MMQNTSRLLEVKNQKNWSQSSGILCTGKPCIPRKAKMTPILVNGVEYEEIPTPTELWRATKSNYANELIRNGQLYLTNVQVYREDPDSKRGDSTETDGNFFRQSIHCFTGHTNPIFLLCTTLESDPNKVFNIWHDYDTIIHIYDVQAFAERILKTAITSGIKGVSFHAGTVTYDKDHGGIRPYHWSESIFQKSERYAEQKEYRIALVGDYTMMGVENVKLSLGPCNDLLTIVKTRTHR